MSSLALCIINFPAFCSIFLGSILVHYNDYCPDVYLFDEISATELGFEKLSRSSEVLFSYFFSFISVCFMMLASSIPKNMYFSFSLSVLILPLFGSSIPSAVSLFTLHYQHETFFNTKFYSYIRGVYSYLLYQIPKFFLILLFL